MWNLDNVLNMDAIFGATALDRHQIFDPEAQIKTSGIAFQYPLPHASFQQQPRSLRA
jgi:hypothetical protein